MSWRHDPERDDVGRHDLLSVLSIGLVLGVMIATVIFVGIIYLAGPDTFNLPVVK